MADGFERIRALNDHLKERSKKLLEEKDQKCAETRRGERQTGIQGDEVELGVDASSYEFNVALINRMQPSEERPDLKAEPTFGQDRYVLVLVVRPANDDRVSIVSVEGFPAKEQVCFGLF